ncbi:MAG: hypothetical protein MI794_21120 [Pseudomonadales bacterium]|nr:hypothetical protein [Pseudomonadales bacterium]
MTWQRIMIVGGPGAGKSWLAGEIARRTGLPWFCVDDAVWRADGTLRPAEAMDDQVRTWALQSAWIIEGGNSRTYQERACRADVLIVLSPPRWLRVCRVLRRLPSRALLQGTLTYDRLFLQKNLGLKAALPEQSAFHWLRSRQQVREFLDGLPMNG